MKEDLYDKTEYLETKSFYSNTYKSSASLICSSASEKLIECSAVETKKSECQSCCANCLISCVNCFTHDLHTDLLKSAILSNRPKFLSSLLSLCQNELKTKPFILKCVPPKGSFSYKSHSCKYDAQTHFDADSC